MGYKYSEEIDGKKAEIELTDMETASAISACKLNSVNSVHILKKKEGGALFFVDPRSAVAAQHRHNYKYSFEIKKADLLKALPKDKKEAQTKK